MCVSVTYSTLSTRRSFLKLSEALSDTLTSLFVSSFFLNLARKSNRIAWLAHSFVIDRSSLLSEFLSGFTGDRGFTSCCLGSRQVARTCRKRLNRHPRRVRFISACAARSALSRVGNERGTQVRVVRCSDKQLERGSTYVCSSCGAFQKESSGRMTAFTIFPLASRRYVLRVAETKR